MRYRAIKKGFASILSAVMVFTNAPYALATENMPPPAQKDSTATASNALPLASGSNAGTTQKDTKKQLSPRALEGSFVVYRGYEEAFQTFSEAWEAAGKQISAEDDRAVITMHQNVQQNLLRTVEKEDFITLDLNGYTLNRKCTGSSSGHVIQVFGNFVLMDSSSEDLESQGSVTGGYVKSKSSGGGVLVKEGGTFTMNGGNITGNKAYDVGAGVSNCGTFIMNGGGISKNQLTSKTNRHGAGIYNQSGTVIINDGLISDNPGPDSSNNVIDGGGLHSWSGSFEMNGGKFTGNSASSVGGGLFFSGGTVSINGGEISENSAGWGGGICFGADTSGSVSYTVTGGSISDNTAYGGGGIYVDSSALSITENALISGNTAEYGGGIYSYGTDDAEASLVLQGGNITANFAATEDNTSLGGGIYAEGTSISVSGDALISENKADWGGGIELYNGSLALTGGSITQNEAGNSGGGVDISSDPVLVSVGGDAVVTDNHTSDGLSSNLFMSSQNPLITLPEAFGEASAIGITLSPLDTVPVPIIKGENNYPITFDDASHVFSDNPDYMIRLNAESNTLQLADWPTLTEIQIVEQPLLNYTEDDALDLSGLRVSTIYDYGEPESLTAESEGLTASLDGISVESGTPIALDMDGKTLCITYQEQMVETELLSVKPLEFQVLVGESDAPGIGSGTYRPGTSVTLDAGVKDGYTFSGWTVVEGNLSLTHPENTRITFVMPKEDIRLLPGWSKIPEPEPEDKPGGDNPEPKPEDKPDGDNPEPEPEDKPGGDKPEPKPEDKPGGDKPEPKPEDKPGDDNPEPKPEDKPGGDNPESKPDNKPGHSDSNESGNEEAGSLTTSAAPNKKPGFSTGNSAPLVDEDASFYAWISVNSGKSGGIGTKWRLQRKDKTYIHGKFLLNTDGTTTEQPAWAKVYDTWFAFDTSGFLKHGFFYDPFYDGWFYMDTDNGMLTGWHLLNGNWYYFEPLSNGFCGRLYTNCLTPDRYYVKESGVWDGKPRN